MSVKIDPKQYRVLRVEHAILGALHLASAIALWVLSPSDSACPAPLYVTLDAWVINGTSGTRETCVVTEQTTHNVGKIYQVYLAIFPALWSGLIHLVIASFRWKAYIDGLRSNYFVYRWMDYVVSSPPMLVLITQLCGVSETWLLVAVGVVSAKTIFLGSLDDPETQPARKRLLTWCITSLLYCVGGWGPGLDALRRSTNVPGAVVAVVVVLFLLFFSFGVVQLVFILFRKCTHECELAFMGLSGVAKTMLHWTLFTAVLARGPTGAINNTKVMTAIAVPILIGAVNVGISVYLWRRYRPKNTTRYQALKNKL